MNKENKKKAKIFVPVIVVLLMVLTSFSGCTTPGTNFDQLKVVATVTRNKGDYAIYTAVGAKSIEALGMTLDTQAISAYKADNLALQKKETKNVYGFWRNIWYRGSKGLHFNTVDDLALTLYNPDLSQLADINIPFALDTNSTIINKAFNLSDLGVMVYTADISTKFPGPGWVVSSIEVSPSNECYGYVIYDGYGYKLVVISSSARSGTQKTVKATVGMYKLDSTSLSTVGNNWYSASSSYADVVGKYAADALSSQTADVQHAANKAVGDLLDQNGLGIVHWMSDISGSFSTSAVDSWAAKNTDELVRTIVYNSKNLPTAYAYLRDTFNGENVKCGGCLGFHTISFPDLTSDDYKFIQQYYDGYDGFLSHWDARKVEKEALGKAIVQDLMKGGFSLYSLSEANLVFWSGDVVGIIPVCDDKGVMTYLAQVTPSLKESLQRLLKLPDGSSMNTILSQVKGWTSDDWYKNLLDVSSNPVIQPVKVIDPATGQMTEMMQQMQLILDNLKLYTMPVIPKAPALDFVVTDPIPTSYIKSQWDIFSSMLPLFSSMDVSLGDPTNWTVSSATATYSSESTPAQTINLEKVGTTNQYIMNLASLGSGSESNGFNLLQVGDTYKFFYTITAWNNSDHTDTITKTSTTYYCKVIKNLLQDMIYNLTKQVNSITSQWNSTEAELETLRNLLNNKFNPFDNPTQNGEDSYAIITVKDSSGNDVTILSPRKSFNIADNGSIDVSWDVTVFQDKPYTVTIVVGNSTSDSVATYTGGINTKTTSLSNPFDWPEIYRRRKQ